MVYYYYYYFYTHQTNTSRVATFTFVTLPFVQGKGDIHIFCTIQAPRQSIGTTPISKLKFDSRTSHSNTAIPPFFKHSTGNPSSPGASPDSFHSLPPLLPPTIIIIRHDFILASKRVNHVKSDYYYNYY